MAGMDASTWVAIAAAVFAGLSWLEAFRQRRLAAALQKAAASPYVWADFRLAGDEGVHLIVKNEGPAVARDVVVTFDPPFISSIEGEGPPQPLSIASMAPGRVMGWFLDVGFQRLAESNDLPTMYRVTVTGRGPFGPLEPLEYKLNFKDYDGALIRPANEGAALQKSISDAAEKVARAVKERNRRT